MAALLAYCRPYWTVAWWRTVCRHAAVVAGVILVMSAAFGSKVAVGPAGEVDKEVVAVLEDIGWVQQTID